MIFFFLSTNNSRSGEEARILLGVSDKTVLGEEIGELVSWIYTYSVNESTIIGGKCWPIDSSEFSNKLSFLMTVGF